MACQNVIEHGHWYLSESGELIDPAGTVRRLEPRVAEVLDTLLERPGHVVSRTELFEQVWRDRIVIDAALTRCVAQIRAALDDRPPHRYVETLPKRGYRFIGRVSACGYTRTPDRIDVRAQRPVPCLALRPESAT
jgi:DNA-binding winged helix-turn-helix (wHTH) protein